MEETAAPLPAGTRRTAGARKSSISDIGQRVVVKRRVSSAMTTATQAAQAAAKYASGMSALEEIGERDQASSTGGGGGVPGGGGGFVTAEQVARKRWARIRAAVFDKIREPPSVRKLLQDSSEVPGSLSWLLNSADGLWLEETQLALSGHRIVKLVDMPPSSTIMQGHDAKSGNFWVYETAQTLEQRRQRPQLWDMVVFVAIPGMHFDIVTGSYWGHAAQTLFWCTVLLVPLASMAVWVLFAFFLTVVVGATGRLLSVSIGAVADRINTACVGVDPDFEAPGGTGSPATAAAAVASPRRRAISYFTEDGADLLLNTSRSIDVQFTLGDDSADANYYTGHADWEKLSGPAKMSVEFFDQSLRALARLAVGETVILLASPFHPH